MTNSKRGRSVKRPPRAIRFEWSLVAFQLAYAHHGDRTLGMYVAFNGAGWFAFAVEGSRSASSVAAVLADHAHVEIGDGYAGKIVARRACERYAARWLRSKVRAARCVCGPIGKEESPAIQRPPFGDL